MNAEKKKKIIKSFLSSMNPLADITLWKNYKCYKDGEPTSWMPTPCPFIHTMKNQNPIITIGNSEDEVVDYIMKEYGIAENDEVFALVEGLIDIDEYEYKGNKYYIAYN